MVFEELQRNVKILIELMWDNRINWDDVERWLDNFDPEMQVHPNERLHALYLLGHFSYFNAQLLRVLVRALFREYVQYPILCRVRKALSDTLDRHALSRKYREELKRVRFVGMGNPSESGTHLLYYFRQENRLPKGLFVRTHELFDASGGTMKLSRGWNHLVFLDDLCASGTQAETYSKKLLSRILAIDSTVALSYFPLFATSDGLRYVRARTRFTKVEPLYELDSSFKALQPDSRYFREPLPNVARDFAFNTCLKHGKELEPGTPLGFKNGQLLLGFAHNVPDNTLPIFWSQGRPSRPWTPIFRRVPKEDI
jgi:hypothetical protein